MGLRILETTLNLQGVLSGAADVSSEGFVKKFARGGFVDGTNAIVNSAVIAPLSYVPNTKNSSLFLKAFDSLKDAEPTQQDAQQPEVNNKYAISSNNPEPLAIFSFAKDDVAALQAAAYQAYFEDRCSLEFSKQLIQKTKQNNEKALSAITKNVEQELSVVEQQLNSTEKYVKSCLELDRSINERSQQLITNFSNAAYSSLGPDALGVDGRFSSNPVSLLNYVGGSIEVLSLKSNTALMTQMMSMASKQMTNGASSLVLGSETAYPARFISKNQPIDNFIDVTYESDTYINLKTLSLSNESNQSFIYGVSEGKTYVSKLKLDTLKQRGTGFQRAAYLMTILSNEMAVSTGLGRLNGTQLGANFGSSGDYRRSFWGADDQVTNATTEATTANSLVDYFVVNEDGQNRLTSQKGVLLFDGTRQKSGTKRKNAFDAFVKGAIRSPLSKTENKVSQYTLAQDAAISRFELGKNFLSTLQCRDKSVKLLTPRGLFARLLADFAEVLLALQSQEKATGKQVREMCLLSILGKNSQGDISSGSPSNVIKRSLLSVMAKKALQIQYALDTAASKVSSSEAQKPKTVSTSTKVTTTDKDGKKNVSTVQTETSDASQTAKSSTQSSFTPNPNPKNPRLCQDEKLLFDARSKDDITDQLIFAFRDLPTTNLPSSKSKSKTIDFSINSLYGDLNAKQDGFIDKLVKIYVDLCDEAVKFCNEDATSSSIINSIGLTRNSQLDGAIMMSLVLEAACFLSADFVNVKMLSSSGFVGVKNTIASNTPELANSKTAAAFLRPASMSMSVNVGSDIQSVLASRSMTALVKAVNSDNLSSAFFPQNGNLIVPEMDALPQTTIISYDGQTTIASMKDTFVDLVIEREIPTLCFSNTVGMIQYCESVSSKYKDFAQQVLGLRKQTDEIKSLVTFMQSQIGANFFASLNDFSIYAAKRRVVSLKNELLAPSGRSPKLTLGELRCIQFFLQHFGNSPTTNNFVTVALPKDFVTKMLNSSYYVGLDRDDSTKDARMAMNARRTSVFTDSVQEFSTVTMIRNPLDANSFSAFDYRPPDGLGDILTGVILDNQKTGEQFLTEKLDTQDAVSTLTSEIVSHLFKKLFSTLSTVDLFADNIVDVDIFAVDSNSASTAKLFASTYGLSPSVFDNCFSKNDKGLTFIDENRLTQLSKLDFDIAESSINVTLPPLKFGEAELFYDLFETVYFQVGAISRRVFSPSVLDETKGFIVNSSNFTSDDSTQQVTVNGKVEKNGIQQSLNNQSSSKLAPQFDTYSVTVSPFSDLVNK